jgi:hypothetical protein
MKYYKKSLFMPGGTTTKRIPRPPSHQPSLSSCLLSPTLTFLPVPLSPHPLFLSLVPPPSLFSCLLSLHSYFYSFPLVPTLSLLFLSSCPHTLTSLPVLFIPTLSLLFLSSCHHTVSYHPVSCHHTVSYHPALLSPHYFLSSCPHI